MKIYKQQAKEKYFLWLKNYVFDNDENLSFSKKHANILRLMKSVFPNK